MVKNIFEVPVYFQLKIGDGIFAIPEPVDWDKAVIHMPRDKDFYGFTSDYIDDKVQCTFLPQDGGDLIRNAYLNYGPDYMVYFEFGFYDGSTKTRLYQGTINTNEYTRDIIGVKATIEKMPFQAKLASRFSTPVTINGFLNFDKYPLSKIPTWNLRLHSKTLYKQATWQSLQQLESTVLTYAGNTGELWITPDESGTILTELQTISNLNMGIVDDAGGAGNNPADHLGDTAKSLLYSYKAIEAGSLNVSFKGQMNFYFFWNGGGFVYNITPIVRIQRLISNVQTIVTTITGGTTSWNSSSPNIPHGSVPATIMTSQVTGSNRNDILGFIYNWNEFFESINIEVNDNVYVELNLNIASTVSGTVIHLAQLDGYQNNIALQQYTVDPSSYCKAYRILDVLNNCVECCTGFANRVKSNFFSPDGIGYNYMLANGFSIRNFFGASYSMKYAIQDALNDLQALFNIGIGYQTDPDGNDYLIVEDMPFFFQDKIILIIPESSNWVDRHNADTFYNEADLGFNKYAQNELYLLDEYCTEGQFLFPPKTIKNTLTRKSGLIGSGYTIEIQRRAQFLQNTSASLINDNDIFIIASEDTTSFQATNVIFAVVVFVNTFSIQATINMIVGDRFTVTGTGTANDNVIYTVISVGVHSGGYDNYVINTTPTTYSGNAVLTLVPINSSYKFAERNENFAVLSNVIDPASVYNARLTLKHILYNLSPLLATSLYWSKAPDQIFTTFPKNNNQVTTQFVSTDPNKGYIGNRVVTEIDNIQVADFDQGQAIFSPFNAGCDAKISADDADLLRRALRGEADDTVNYGLIVIPDDTGQMWKCWVMDFKYNEKTQLATFDLNKKEKYSPTSNIFV